MSLSVVQRLRSSRSGDRIVIWRMTHPGLRPGWSVIAALLAGAVAAVAWLVQRRTGTSSEPVILLVVASIAVAAVAMLIGAAHRAIVPVAIAVAVSYAAYRWRADLAGGPLSGPFGYRNAFGALLFQGAIAWLMAGFAFAHPVTTAISVVPAGALAFLAVRSSLAAAVGVALVAVAALALAGRTGVRVAIALCGAASAIVLAVTVWLAVTYEPELRPAGIAARIADAGITERRLALWHDAIAIAEDEPAGIGHGRFGVTSPTALEDRDTVFAHNEFLEQAAELGWAAGALIVLLVGWGFLRLWVNPGRDAATAFAAVALAGGTIHASVDFVWHTPAVVLAVAALVGTGFVPSRQAMDR